MAKDFLFTSESVTEGHPDKLCDQVSDAIVDQFLRHDPQSHIIAECAAAKGILFIAARFASRATVDIPQVARQVIHQIGYNGGDFDAASCSVLTSLQELPLQDYARVVAADLSNEEIERIPVRNQATVFGYACDHTSGFMPLPLWLAHKLARRLTAARLARHVSYLGPDGTTQVGVEFREGRPHRIQSITLIASQGPEQPRSQDTLRDDLMEHVVQPTFVGEEIAFDANTKVFVNPGGAFIGGGPAQHSGMTGRKTGVDTYGEFARHSGAALSGKDCLRIDRIGAYAARHAAKNVVAAGLARECEVQLSYTIGLSRPVSLRVETFRTGRLPDEEIAHRLTEQFDFRPAGIMQAYRLQELPALVKGGFYRRLAAYGHMGRMDISLPWEKTDRADALL